jgi:uncharacterized sporulation protein YeaH/YhbH (DUF444 family)
MISSGEDKINSNESEGIFTDFIEEQVDNFIEDFITKGDIEDNGSEIIVEVDDITPPVFTFDDDNGSGSGSGGEGPGDQREKLKFSLSYEQFMERMKNKLKLPNLSKEGRGRIKEFSYKFKSFANTGILLDKKRTFKKALRTSVALGDYDPSNEKYDIYIRKRDKKFKVPEKVERPKYKAVVMYVGDISYSTSGKRIEIQKRIVNFIENWVNYSYGKKNVEHRYFVHNYDSYEVQKEDFYKVGPSGGTYASPCFKLVDQISTDEYDFKKTNLYLFYFGDGELFGEDTNDICKIVQDELLNKFNRIGFVELIPSNNWSNLISSIIKQEFPMRNVRYSKVYSNKEIIKTIINLFGNNDQVDITSLNQEEGDGDYKI